jgi:hypothetical protein
MWRYADACYDAPKEPTFLFADETIRFNTINDDTDYCMMSEEQERIVIAVRGSDSKHGNMKAWISNMQGIDRIKDTIDPGIHDGFAQPVHRFIEAVARFVFSAHHQPKPIYLTGHSRGSAIAGIMSRELCRNYEQKLLSVICFGTPNYCNKEIRNEINMMPIDYTNVNTTHDLVSKIPPHPIMYRPGKEYELKTNFFLPIPAIPPLRIARGIIDHLPETYTKLLKKRK